MNCIIQSHLPILEKNQESAALKIYFDLTETYNLACSQRKGDSMNEKLSTRIFRVLSRTQTGKLSLLGSKISFYNH